MNIKMRDSNLKDIKEVKEFLENSNGMEFEKLNRAAAYSWTEETMRKLTVLN